DVGKKRAEIKQLKRLIAAPVARERKRIEKEEAEKATAEAYVEICGPAPSNVTFGLTNALKKTAHDPDSIEVTTCTTPAMTKTNCWVFDCGVRGTNMLGAKVFQTRTFRYSRLLGYQEDK